MNLSLEGESDEKIVKKGELLFKEGDSCKNLFLVSDGLFLLFTQSDKRIVPLYVINPGEMIGEESLFDKKYKFSCVALEDSKLHLVSLKDIKTTLESSPEWVNKIFQILTERLSSAQEIIREHKIIDPLLNGGEEFEAEDEAYIKKLI